MSAATEDVAGSGGGRDAAIAQAVKTCIGFGVCGTNKPPAGHWLNEMWDFGAYLAAARSDAPQAAPLLAALIALRDHFLWRYLRTKREGTDIELPPEVIQADDAIRAAGGPGLHGRCLPDPRTSVPTERPALTDEQIVEIRDGLLPSQGERFDCIAFARAVLSATEATK